MSNISILAVSFLSFLAFGGSYGQNLFNIPQLPEIPDVPIPGNVPLLGNLQSLLDTDESVNIFITLADGPETIFNNIISGTFLSRTAKIDSLVNRLKDHANRTQQIVMDVINRFAETTGQNVTVKSYWISNQIYVQGANKILVTLLQSLGSVIGWIREELYAGFGPTNPKPVDYGNETDYTWAMIKVDAPGAWELQSQVENLYPVLIGGIDSGVRYTHDELRRNFVGEYGWFDPRNKAEYPNDGNGHGTHTMATIVGKNVGIAPNTKWMACKGCQTEECAQSDILSCGEFMLCPTKADGTEPDCSKAPDIINNSWGSQRGGDDTYVKMVAAWRSAGIIPVFSAGNNGPGCSTLTSPGDFKNVISVGSTNIKDELSKFSSKGPAGGFLGIGGSQKPDIAAPGEDIISAWHSGDYDYRRLSGTSMAAPVVSGTIGLMMQVKTNLTFDEIKNKLLEGVTQDGRRPSIVCEPQLFKFRYPNNEFGKGILNAKNTLAETIE